MTTLPGTELLGRPYDLQGRYARAEALNPQLQLFDLPQVPARSVTVCGKVYSHPEILTVIPHDGENCYDETETFTTQNLSSQFKVAVDFSAGISGLFGAELGERYERKSTSNLHFFHVTEKGWAHAYTIALPELSELKRHLKRDVRLDLNNPRLEPAKVVESYGTYFLNAAIFGGHWSFTRSLSRFQYHNETQAATRVQGSFLELMRGRMDTQETEIQSRTVSETRAKWRADGGLLSTLPDFVAWAKSVEAGEFAFVDFDNATSLRPLSVLADDAARQRAIQTAIEQAIPKGPAKLSALAWRDAQPLSQGGGGVDLEARLTDPHKVVVGFGATVHGGKGRVTHLAVKWLDLRSGETGWLCAPRSGVSAFNRSDYEMVYPVSGEESLVDGMVPTLLKLRAEGGSLHEMEMLYHKLDPADLEGNGDYLSQNERIAIYRHSTDAPRHSTQPGQHRVTGWDRQVDLGGERVIVGIGLSYNSDDGSLPELRLTTARLRLEDILIRG